MTAEFERFIEKLAQTPVSADVFNQYDQHDPNNAIRRHNLLLYLRQMQALKPSVLLVAEAPGYRGMRLTGVPFSSRALITEGIPNQPLYGEQHGYKITDEWSDATIWREATASIVWDVLKDVHPPSVHWNSFPFHPHKPDNSRSNRKPRKPELDLGRPFLETFIALFQPETVAAIGNTAHQQLLSIGIEAKKVRHPAQGGKNDFVSGVREIFSI